MKVLIIEDEQVAAKRLERIILEVSDSYQVIGKLASIEAAVEWFQQHPEPDLIMMDIQLADGHSFEIFKEVTLTAPVIFTTAYDEYALEAFKVNSIDYLLKPIKEGELVAALQKFERFQLGGAPWQQAYSRLQNFLSSQSPSYQKRILIRYGAKIKALEIKEAAYFFLENKITILRTHEGKNYPVDYNLDELEALLDPEAFFRVNRQMIISYAAIAEMYTHTKSRVKIALIPEFDQEVVVSADRSPNFKAWLTGK